MDRKGKSVQRTKERSATQVAISLPSGKEAEPQRLELLRNIFRAPHEAYELFLNSRHLGKKEIFRTHFTLWLFAPIGKILYNILSELFRTVFQGQVFHPHPMSGTLKAWIIYPVFLFLVYQMDAIRMYYKKIHRSEGETLPPPLLLAIAFLPFSASAIFWIFPFPIPQVAMLVSFLFSLQISYYALKIISNYTNQEFGIFLFFSAVYFLTGATILTFLYNVIRTLLN